MNTFKHNKQNYNYQILGDNYPISFIIKTAAQSLGMLSIDYINDELTVTGMVNQVVCQSNEDLNVLVSHVLTEILKESNQAKINVQLIN